jgi:hypothetical protein
VKQKGNAMRKYASAWTLLLGLGLACSGGQDATEIEQVDTEAGSEALDAPETPEQIAEVLAYKRQLEAYLGPIELADPAHEEPIDSIGDGPGYDDLLAAPNANGEVEKTITPIIWGWAVKGVNQMQDGNTSGPDESGSLDHCTATPGSGCDNLVHSQAIDLQYTSANDFANDLLGRCGRFDSTVDNAWKPCVIPYGKKPGSVGQNKKWTIGWDFSQCASSAGPLPTWAKDLLKEALLLAVSRWGDENGTEIVWATTADPTMAEVKLYCDTSGIIPTGKIAVGYPIGDLTPQYAAIHAVEEWCETPPHDPLLGAHHFADFYYTYTQGRVGINWDSLWTFLYGCGSDTLGFKNRATKIFAHELGHVLGFSHQQLPATDVMNKNRSCNWANGNSMPNQESRDTLWWLDINHSNPLQLSDNDLSCHSPLGGGESGGSGVTD